MAVLREGTGFGNPETLTKTMNTLMTQGSWETTDPKRGNRAPALMIEVEGETADGLNAGEVWLSALMGDFNAADWAGALEWLPPRQSVWTVFDVTSCYIERSQDKRWDLDEHRFVRTYRVPIRALPHARSRDKTITPAQPSSAFVDVQIDSGTSTSGWSARWNLGIDPNGGTAITPTVVSGHIRVTRSTGPSSYESVGLRRNVTIPTDTPYLRVDRRTYQAATSPAHDIYVTTSTGARYSMPAVAATKTDVGGGITQTISYYRVPADISNVEVVATIDRNVTGAYLEVDQLRRVSSLPPSSTGRQKVQTLIPGGSAPAEGSLQVESAAATKLDRVIVYTYPLGRPMPTLAAYRVSPTTGQIADTDTIHGQRWPLANIVAFEIPAWALHVQGMAALYAKVRCDTASATLSWTMSAVVGDTYVASKTGRVTVTGPSSRWQMVALGLVDVPGARIGTNGRVRITMVKSAGSGTLWFDEGWTFGVDENSALSIVDCGEGAASVGASASQLWIDAPSAVAPAGSVTAGHGGRANEYAPSDYVHQVHRFPAEGVSVLTAAFGSEPKTGLDHFRRWTHHAGS
ncbi:hypothetical protein [Nocardioides sp. SYSU D00065]|uniref:hypothetical protein n=1 Tax=Nocardioides sp. SYSU D00065 TaxID=2817378 RepID=UPI001B344724|nr:hypothetical protein [Nocardioides sp. SYSU D00065]